jgi:hypothetical protein
MFVECEAFKTEVIDAHQDSIVASVVWADRKAIPEIFLIRRSDVAILRLAVPRELKPALADINCDAVRRYALTLNNVVILGVFPANFKKEANIGSRCLRDGARPASPGSLRIFKQGLIGVDFGEYDLPKRRWFN